ncbi:uncharacterized protein EDB93DRAFT_1102483 [Suillus bovinus]|uniref:uncharacterized protein n=1 Tax=Suillus bovinus TaxID=48563 RepID=UPI001B86B6FC|nr:uncharacterized protein EDB93DRAFT_1102483 [Suillus bovinus]KAG2153659.1 hypothetical protein EDB93DRAFT_1102483 [Suillus bovinus]
MIISANMLAAQDILLSPMFRSNSYSEDDGRRSRNNEDIIVSPNEEIMHDCYNQHLLEYMKDHVHSMEVKHNMMCKRHKAKLEQCHNRIDRLKEKVKAQESIIDMMNDDINQLEAEVAEKESEIKKMRECQIRDTRMYVECSEYLKNRLMEVIKDHICRFIAS